MRNSSPFPINVSGSELLHSAGSNPLRAFAATLRLQGGWRTLFFAFAAAAALAVCGVHFAVAGADTGPASGIGYLCDAIILFGCAAVLLRRIGSATGPTRIRWYVFSAAVLCESAGFVPSFTECVLGTGAARPFQTACFNASEALFLVSAVLFFAGVTRSIVVMDLLQALVFVVLRFNLAYSPFTQDHFTNIHLIVGQSVALVLFLVALVASLGAASRAEQTFLRTLAGFFGLRLIGFFTADQVSYIWLHHVHSSRWDVVGDVLFAGFALYWLRAGEPDEKAKDEVVLVHAPGVAVRSLMPSFLALVNLMLGLFMLRISTRVAAVAISVTVVSYVVRTALLHAQAVHERAHLEIRNQHLEGLAVRDPLTGIGNRRSLARVYERLQADHGGVCVSLLLMDIDSFKRANDCHGHQFGDEVLTALARKLETVSAGVAGSHCARLGGDEFALLLPDVTPLRAMAQAEAVRALLKAHRFAAEVGVTVSVGIASHEAARDLPLETLARRADEALYRAKRLGRDRVEMQPVGEPGLDAATVLESPVGAELEETLR